MNCFLDYYFDYVLLMFSFKVFIVAEECVINATVWNIWYLKQVLRNFLVNLNEISCYLHKPRHKASNSYNLQWENFISYTTPFEIPVAFWLQSSIDNLRNSYKTAFKKWLTIFQTVLKSISKIVWEWSLKLTFYFFCLLCLIFLSFFRNMWNKIDIS